jgi:hypothetical protein
MAYAITAPRVCRSTGPSRLVVTSDKYRVVTPSRTGFTEDMIASMTMDDAPRRLNVELQRSPEPGGWVSGDGTPRRFDGWLQLLAALEQAIHEQPPRAAAHTKSRRS